MASLKLNEEDSVSEADRDTLAPLPPPTAPSPWGTQMPYSGSYIPQSTGFMPMPFNYASETINYGTFGREGSAHSGSGGSTNGCDPTKEKDRKSASPGGSDSEVASQRSGGGRCPSGGRDSGGGGGGGGGGSSGSDRSVNTQMSRDVGRLETVPSELAGSRQSFRMAMGNPCEFFVDVM